MSDNSNSRIAKNTMLLYLRMFVILAISLYTSRQVLSILGVEDFGLYNVVGSIVATFAFIRSAMGNATHRYITFSLGKGDEKELNGIFSTCVIVHFILAIIIIVLCETVGLWLFYQKMVIPPERITAALYVFQFSILTSAMGVICVPYDAVIIAHEKMGAFAFISFFDVVIKLIIVISLKYIPFDRLIIYASLLFCLQVLERFIYSFYCHRHFNETHFKFIWNGEKIREIFSFAGWNIVGNMAALGCTPIINVLLNMFFGPAVNAARGLAVQVQHAVSGFVNNFQLAVTPQITKSYAADNLNRVRQLIISSSKLTFFLFFCMALPLWLEAEKILSIWLVEVPNHTVSFMRIVLFILLVEAWEQPLHIANLATGKIRVFQLLKGLSLLTMIPISYFALKQGTSPESVFIIQLVVTLGSLQLQLFLIKPMIGLSLREYYKAVFLRPALVFLCAVPLPLLAHIYLPSTTVVFIVLCVFDASIAVLTSYLLGMNNKERMFVKEQLQKIFAKIKK